MQTEYIENKLAVFLVLVNVYTAIDQGLDLTFGQLPCLCRGVILYMDRTL
jgi:hypothetical protein